MAADDQPDPNERPRVFVSWSHASDAARDADDPEAVASADAEWREQVWSLTTVLRQHGIDADVDLLHTNDIAIDWTRYGPNAVAAADVVLAVGNAAWRDAWEDSGDGARGRGAVAEVDVLRSLFNDGRDRFQGSLVIVNLPGSTVRRPLGLDRVPRVAVRTFDAAGISDLVRMLTGQPQFPVPPLGPVPVLPPHGGGGTAPSNPEWVTVEGPGITTGTGDTVIDVEVPVGAVGVLTTIQGNEAGHHFAVRPLGGRTLVNTTDAYRGTTFLPLPDGEPAVRMEVKATGRWTLAVESIDEARPLPQGDAVTGSGDAVLRYDGPGGIARITGNEARRHFAVRVIAGAGGRGRSLVNAVTDYEGFVPWTPGPALVVVHAVGQWSISIR